MSVEQVIVASTGRHYANVLARQNRHCQGCAANSACGHYLLDTSRVRSTAAISLPLPDTMVGTVKPGDSLSLVTQETHLMQLAVVLYGLPLAAMLAGTVLPAMLLPDAVASDAWSVTGAILGLVGGLQLVRALQLPVPARLAPTQQPEHKPRAKP